MRIASYHSLVSLFAYATPIWASLIAGVLVVVTLSLSMYLLFDHLSAYKNPEEQKFLIGVILMVPCYAVESFVSLTNPTVSIDCEILRDCYESFAMYCFGRYLVACLGGEERTIEFMEREGRASHKAPLLEHNSERGIVTHPFPMNYILKPWELGRWFYQLVKIGIVQYMIIKSLTALLAVVLEAFNVYCEGEFKWGCGYPYMAVVLNFSQSWALYCLIQFYTVTKDELAHIKPLAKFLTFKSIVFLTWWQGVAIALLYSLGLFKSPIAQGLQFKSSVQDFIICIEMAIASIVHLYVFPAKPYEQMGECFSGDISVLGDYSADCPLDPDEIRDSERPTKLRLPRPDVDIKSGMTIRESVRDVFVGGSGYIVNDVKFTVNQAVEPVEKGITKFNEKIHKISQNIKRHDKDRRKTKDDSCIASSHTRRVIRGLLKTWSSPFALRVVWALKLKGVQFDSIEEDLSNKSPLLLQYNPVHKKIPVLVHNGKPISESLVILEYVDETWRQYPLLPDGPYDRARARFWAKFSDDKVSPSIWGVFIKQGKEREEAFDQVFENLKFLEEELQGKRFFGGEKIGFADLALGWIAERVCVLEEIIGVKIVEEEKYPRVSAWMQEFVKVPIIKESLPPHEKLVTKIRGIREKFIGAA